MAISEKDRLAEVLLRHPQLIPPLMRLGIRPGVGDLTVSSACVGLQVHSDLLMQLLNVLADDTYLPDNALAKFDMLPLIDYLKNVHVDLLNCLQLCGRHIRILISSAGDSGRLMEPVNSFFEEYSSEVSSLIEEEESKLIPFLSHLYELYFSPGYSPGDVGKIGESLSLFGSRYDEVEKKMTDLMNLFVRHLQGDYDRHAFYGIIQFLQGLAFDIQGLRSVEMKLLKPLANEMAQEVRQRARKMAVQP